METCLGGGFSFYLITALTVAGPQPYGLVQVLRFARRVYANFAVHGGDLQKIEKGKYRTCYIT